MSGGGIGRRGPWERTAIGSKKPAEGDRGIVAEEWGDDSRDGRDDDLDPGEETWEGGEKDAALDRFIGPMYTSPNVRDDEVPDCPACGTSYASFRASGRLGCPRCYVAFRRFLLPFLGRFHRQVTHLGKFPRRAAGRSSRLGEITRARIALEKAVSAEDFEEAARLRDHIRKLEEPGASGGEPPPEGDEP